MTTCRTHAICFAASGNVTGSRARWVTPIEAAWPGPCPPAFTHRGLDPLVGLLEDAARARPVARPDAVLAVLGPAEAPRAIDRLIESLAAANVPAVCLIDDPAPWREVIHPGILFLPTATPPASVGAMLFALAERQPAIDLLTQELSLAHRGYGGMRSEMDRMHEELHLAAAVQREFTSGGLPQVPGLDLSVLFRPVNFVSGDIYHVRPLLDGKVAFFLADAVGHGVPAALLTMVLTSSLVTTQARNGTVHVLEPVEVLQRLNDRLCQSCLGSGRFATALYGVIDSARGEVTVAGAGHPLPVHLSRSGAMELRAEGPLLGVFPDAEFAQATITLRGRDSLLLYTDGFEAMFPHRAATTGAAWGGRTYLAEMERLVGSDAGTAESLQELERLLDEQSGSLHQCDDVTALVISLSREASLLPTRLAA